MSRLIEEIQQYLLALYHGDKGRYKTLDIVLLKDQFEASEEYSASKYNPLRNALDDLMKDKRAKLNHYLSQNNFTRNSKYDHAIIQDIYDWAGTDQHAYYERYINLLENGSISYHSADSQSKSRNKESKSKIDHKPIVQYFKNDEILEEVKQFWKDSYSQNNSFKSPSAFATMIFYFFKYGFFLDEIKENDLYKDFDFCKWIFEKNNCYKLLELEKAPRYTHHKSGLFDLFNENKKPLKGIDSSVMGFSKRIHDRYKTNMRKLELKLKKGHNEKEG